MNGPLYASAISTAKAPETIAPRNGTNDARNTVTPIGIASGTPRIAAPTPMPMPSIEATKICVRA